jgi:hypothetical protein
MLQNEFPLLWEAGRAPRFTRGCGRCLPHKARLSRGRSRPCRAAACPAAEPQRSLFATGTMPSGGNRGIDPDPDRLGRNRPVNPPPGATDGFLQR